MTAVWALVDRGLRRPSLAADLESGTIAVAVVLARAAFERTDGADSGGSETD